MSCVRGYLTYACSTDNHKTNRFGLNSLNRQALTGIDQCSDGGMRMSHVFSIIYTALLFLSPPLRQVSILLRRNQSVICQALSIRRLIYVSYCRWLHASVAAGGVKREQTKRRCARYTNFLTVYSQSHSFNLKLNLLKHTPSLQIYFKGTKACRLNLESLCY